MSDSERYEHCLTHCPPAPWCEDCIAGKGVEQAHRQVNVHDPDFVAEVIQADYFYLADRMEAADEQNARATCIPVYDTDSGMGVALH
eukprot:10837347-Alexandrium_andersonii.AAC.1